MKPVRLILIAAILCPLLAGCKPDTPTPEPVMDDTCGAAALQSLVGAPETDLTGVALPDSARVIHPGDAVTKDYRLDRLNIHINAEGVIDRVICG